MKNFLIVDDSQSWLKHHENVIRHLYGEDAEITLAQSAGEANNILYQNIDKPFDIILTDLQMESDFLPLYAGEWLIEQIQNIVQYKNTKIIIISATSSIRLVAEKYNVDYIPKYNCRSIEAYENILNQL